MAYQVTAKDDGMNVNNGRYCINCKYCSYNVKLKEFEKANIFRKIFLCLSGKAFFDIELKHPVCLHEAVYKVDSYKLPVFGEEGKDKMFCGVARTNSLRNFHCCGEDGEYFEEI